MTRLPLAILAILVLTPCSRGGAAEEPAGPAGPVVVVVLGPRIDAGDPKKPAAELLCDALAAALARDQGLKVVDRTAIDRVLKEHAADPAGPGAQAPARPLMAFDLMARLTFDTVRPIPRVRLALLDLSTGNVLAEESYEWKEQPDQMPLDQMVRLASAAGAKAGARTGLTGLKVRILGVANASTTARVEPLAGQLEEMLEAAVADTPGCIPVRHLDAASASEESLLLFMGLSRLGGGRRFTPLADVALEATIREVDPQGKEFSQTQLDVDFRLTPAGGSAGGPPGWKTLSGKAAEWDALSAKVCAAAVGEVKLVRKTPAGGDAADPAGERRRQARAELDAAFKGPFKGAADERHRAQMEQMAAAMKLDPTFEEAAYWHATLSNGVLPGLPTPNVDRSKLDFMAGLAEGMKYLDRFKGAPEHRRQVLYLTFPNVNWALGKRVENILVGHEKLTPEELRMLDALKDHADRALGEFPPAVDSQQMIPLVCIGMENAGVSGPDRWAWVEGALKRLEGAAAAPGRSHDYLWRNYWGALQYALRENDTERAEKYLDKLLPAIPDNQGTRQYTLPSLRKLIAGSGNARLIAKLGENRPPGPAPPAPGIQPVRVIEIKPPAPALFESGKAVPPGMEGVKFNYKPDGAADRLVVLPVLRTDNRVYAVVVVDNPSRTHGRETDYVTAMARGNGMDNVSERLACVELDARGRPTGELKFIETPKFDKPLDISSAAQLAGRAYFGTRSHGLLELTEETGRWRALGLGEGLPVKRVRSLQVLDDKTVLGSGVNDDVNHEIFFFSVEDGGRIKLLHTPAKADSVDTGNPVSAAWRYDGKIMATGSGGIWEDIGGKSEKSNRTYFQVVGAPDKIAGLHWLVSDAGLFGHDDAGKQVRALPWNEYNYKNGSGGLSSQQLSAVGLRGDIPRMGNEGYGGLTNDRGNLFLSEGGVLGGYGAGELMICYEPSSDTWYGPIGVGLRPWRVIGAGDGVWIGGDRGLKFMETAAFKAAATDARRVMTSAELKKKQADLGLALPPLELAKFYVGKRDAAKAGAALESVLAGKPGEPEALLMMGFVKEALANRPEEALAWYGKLAGLEGNPSARLTGLVATLSVRYKLQQYEEVVSLGQKIKREFPRIDWGLGGKDHAFNYSIENAQWHLDHPTPGRPAATRPASPPAPP